MGDILPLRHPQALSQALAALAAGELIVIPTETVYGIAAPLHNNAAIERLYQAKDRVPEPALPLLLADAGGLSSIGRPSRAALRLARRYWPGPLTLIVAPGPDFPPEIELHRVAFRVSELPELHALLIAAGGMLVVSWAARSGNPPAITAQEAAAQVGEYVSLILDGGPSPLGIPSTIVDCIEEPPVIVRRGSLSEEKIWAALK
ncbi:MAG TPA: threonylcarbamoyl-AMP synthase [Chloroflexi bacterium]|nr:threonylcarbamoyl-AMP synthase [Chloroflexota bacterium]